MSLNIPPPPLTYSYGGGAGSREQVLICKSKKDDVNDKTQHIW